MEQGTTGGLAVTGDQRMVVEVLLRRGALVPRVRERLEMVKALALGQDLASIGRWSGRSERTVRRWVERFVAGGPAALADAARPGRPPRADAAYLVALEAAVAAPPAGPWSPLRCLDLGAARRLSGRADGETDRAGLAAHAPGPT